MKDRLAELTPGHEYRPIYHCESVVD
jgi:hypothetical protein